MTSVSVGRSEDTQKCRDDTDTEQTEAEMGVMHLETQGSFVWELTSGLVLGFGARPAWGSESPPTIS